VLADMNSRADHCFAFFKAKLLGAHVRCLARQHADAGADAAPPEPEDAGAPPAAAQPRERLWLSAAEESAFHPLWAEVCALLGLRDAALADAARLYNPIDRSAHVHVARRAMPALAAHFRERGERRLAASTAPAAA